MATEPDAVDQEHQDAFSGKQLLMYMLPQHRYFRETHYSMMQAGQLWIYEHTCHND